MRPVPCFARNWLPAGFAGCRRGGAAVEFALVGLALMLFLMAIVDLGMLGFSIAAQAHAIQATARQVAMDASYSLANSVAATPEPCEDSATTIQGYFNSYASPPLQPATATGNPSLTVTWYVNPGGTAPTTPPPALYFTLVATNKWVPFGLSSFFGKGLTITLSTVATVMGTDGIANGTVLAAC